MRPGDRTNTARPRAALIIVGHRFKSRRR